MFGLKSHQSAGLKRKILTHADELHDVSNALRADGSCLHVLRGLKAPTHNTAIPEREAHGKMYTSYCNLSPPSSYGSGSS